MTTITIDRNDKGDTLKVVQITDRTRARNRDNVVAQKVKIVERIDTVYIQKDSVNVEDKKIGLSASTDGGSKRSGFLTYVKWITALICAVIVSRIGHLFQERFKSEPCDANCVDVDNTRRLQDSEVRGFIIEQCGAKSVAEFQRLTMEEQTRIVLDTKAEGASIRQVMSHTGWSYRRVREAGDEVVVKN